MLGRSITEIKFALSNDLIQKECHFVPFRNDVNEQILLHYFNQGLVPNDLAILSVIGIKSANASKNSTILFTKIYYVEGDRGLVQRNIEQYVNLGNSEYILRGTSCHEIAILVGVQIGAQVIKLIRLSG